MKSIALKSPAKINLYLKVISKRKDGFHNLETIFERINLFDTIKLKQNRLNKIRFFCKNSDVPVGRLNLCFKAAQLLKDEFCVKEGADITLIKRIPVAAGLGGGSSNAAFVLLGLNKLWRLGLDKKTLLRLGARLGSDVPFFVLEQPFALGRGRGERLLSLKGIKPRWHILVIPRQRLSTARVFNRLNLKLTKKKLNVNIFTHALKKYPGFCLASFLINDLEKPAFMIQPGILNIKNILKKSGLEYPVLSGSGSALFGLVDSKDQAQALKARLKSQLKAEVLIVKTY